jgi:hypothetical protein
MMQDILDKENLVVYDCLKDNISNLDANLLQIIGNPISNIIYWMNSLEISHQPVIMLSLVEKIQFEANIIQDMLIEANLDGDSNIRSNLFCCVEDLRKILLVLVRMQPIQRQKFIENGLVHIN